MITVTYKDLKKMDACRAGKKRFAKRGWFNMVFLNRPVSLYDIVHDGYNRDSDFCWLVAKMQTSLTRGDYINIATGIKELLIKHKKWDISCDDHTIDPDIHRLNKAVRHVLYTKCTQALHRMALLYIPLGYNMGYYGPGNNDLHQDMRDFLINLDATVDWSKDRYTKWH